MRVQVEFSIETPDFGEAEFRREIEKLIADIDPVDAKLIDFTMYEVTEDSK